MVDCSAPYQESMWQGGMHAKINLILDFEPGR
jgi:hypothetical protein